MKYVKKQTVRQSGKNYVRNHANRRGSATGFKNDCFVQKGGGWQCKLCYENVKPLIKVNGVWQDLPETVTGVMNMSQKILWVNRDSRVVHRKQMSKKFGRDSYVYVCMMSHFKTDNSQDKPVDENGCCEMCKTRVIQIEHPVFRERKIYVNMKDSKVHYRKHKGLWCCIIYTDS